MKVIDPVCKMEVETEIAQWKSEYKGTAYYFTAPDCKSTFDEDPEKYLSGAHDRGHHDHNHEDHHH
jgi:YHS domain-containing protein